MIDIPTYTISDTTHTFAWGDGTSLEVREPTQERRHVWGNVLAYAAPGALLNRKSIDFMNQGECDRFAAGCAALDGAVVWGPRLLFVGHHLAETLEQEEPVTPGVPELSVPWPQVEEAAYYGLAGDIVRTIEPQTESDPVAILVQLLTMVGNVIGRAPYFPVEADRHHMNLFTCLVGQSSKGRKGTSAGHPRRLVTTFDRAWSQRVMGGLSSGEGVIWHLRDPVYGQNKKGEEVCLDAGEADKRLCILETEFARALAKTGQEGNVLSAVLRQAWDHGDLRTLVSGRQKAPVAATNAHVSVIAHITVDEVRRLLTETEAANGFGNRFLWVCVRRSKLLPRGGSYPEQALKPLSETLAPTIFHAQTVAQMRRTPEAEARWEALYTALAEGHSGLLGAITARAEAQVLRLSCLYALLEQTNAVDVPHLDAAYALWQFCEASARYIFGDVLGDPVADDIRRMLQQAGHTGMTRTDINNAFGRNVKSAAIGQALTRLQRDGLACPTVHRTAGRPVERWFAHAPRGSAPYEKNELNEKSLPAADAARAAGVDERTEKNEKSSPASIEQGRSSPLNSFNSVNSSGGSERADSGMNAGDVLSASPLNSFNSFNSLCTHLRVTSQDAGQTVCLDCGELLETSAPPSPSAADEADEVVI
jgi:hypothetical protein